MAGREDPRSLAGKVALITGAGAGIGREDAILLAARGADIVVQDIDGPGAEATAARVREAGRRAEVMVCDVAEVAAFAASAREAERAFGRIDLLVNNAGVHESVPFEDITEARFARMFDVNVKGAFFAARAVVPGMKARRSGAIINIASTAGQWGTVGDCHYCGSKAALLGLTKAWAKELAPWGIRVNCIAPGPVATEMAVRNRGWDGIRERAEREIPLKRYGEPEDIAHAVAFLASAQADFVTGQVMSVNGGLPIVGI